ncbi:MAG: hypothetical protein Q8941_06405 [Bacteroidota bacterium]|nr:hypothetical protein [Bacteroidota bacterium]
MSLKLFQKNRALILIFLAMFASCHVMLIGAYDQVTDQSIQQIQTEVSTLLVKIEKNIANNTPNDNKYENLKGTYDNIEGEIKSLVIRVNSLPKYKIISQQIELLGKNIQDMEAFNKIGFTSIKPVQIIDSTFQVQFSAMTSLQNGLKRQKNTN